eukprot:365508-Chlamydomonas_euryale.AAC.3
MPMHAQAFLQGPHKQAPHSVTVGHQQRMPAPDSLTHRLVDFPPAPRSHLHVDAPQHSHTTCL